MPYRYYLPDGSSVSVPDNVPVDVAEAKARERFPDRFKTQTASEEGPSRKASFFHGAERGVLPGLAGIAGSRAAGALASWALGPEVGIPVTLASLVGGIGTAMGTGAAQEKALEHAPRLAEALGQDVETQRAEREAHPYYGAAGEGLASLLGMKPNLGLLRNAATRNPALAKMAVNAGVGAGIDTGFQLYNGQPYDPIQALIAAGVGGLGAEENRIGRRAAALGEAPVNLMRGRKAFPETVIPKKEAETEETLGKQFPEVSEKKGRKPIKETPPPVDLAALLSAEKEPPPPVTAREEAPPPDIEQEGPPPGYGEELPPPTSEAAAPPSAVTPPTNKKPIGPLESGLSKTPTGANMVAETRRTIEENGWEQPDDVGDAGYIAYIHDAPFTNGKGRIVGVTDPGQQGHPLDIGLPIKADNPESPVIGETSRLEFRPHGPGHDTYGWDWHLRYVDKSNFKRDATPKQVADFVGKDLYDKIMGLDPRSYATKMDLMQDLNRILREHKAEATSAKEPPSTNETTTPPTNETTPPAPPTEEVKQLWAKLLEHVKQFRGLKGEEGRFFTRMSAAIRKDAVTPEQVEELRNLVAKYDAAQARWDAYKAKQAEEDKKAAEAEATETAEKRARWEAYKAKKAAEAAAGNDKGPRRLDSKQYPAVDEADHTTAVEALQNGQFVVVENFKGDKRSRLPSGSVFHTTYGGEPITNISDANALLEVLTNKTAERPELVKIIPPDWLVEGRDRERVADRLSDKDEAQIQRAVEQQREQKLDEAISESSDPNNAQEVTSRFEQKMRAKAEKASPPSDLEIAEAMRRIKEREASVKRETLKLKKKEPTEAESAADKRAFIERQERELAARESAKEKGEEGKEGEKEKEKSPAPLPEPTGTKTAEEINAELRANREGHIDRRNILHAASEDRGNVEDTSKEPTHSSESLLAALKKTFGVHTQRLLNNGFIKIFPESPEGKHILGSYFGDSNHVELYANNIPKDFDLKGLLLHEVGTHAGLETMLGPDLFKQLLAEVKTRAKAGERPFVEADKRVPYSTERPWQIDEERLAYLASNYKDLPFVKRMYAQIRQFIWRKMGGRFIELSNDDIQAMVMASYKRMGRLAKTGNLADAARSVPNKLQEEYLAKIDEANRKLAETDVRYHAEKPDFTPEDEKVEPRSDAEHVAEAQKDMAAAEKKKLERGSVKARLKDWFRDIKERPGRKYVTAFQDVHRLLKENEDALRALGRLDPNELGLHEILSLRPSDAIKSEVSPVAKRANDAFRRWVRKTKDKPETALAKLKTWMIGLTEPDLRKYLFSRYTPMNDEPRMFPGQSKPISAAQLREVLVKAHETTKDLTSPDAMQKYGYDAKSLRKYMDYLAENYAERGGFVPESAPEKYQRARLTPGIESPDHSTYDIGVSQADAKRWRDDYYKNLNGKDGQEIKDVFDTARELRDKATELGFRNGHLGQHFTNAVAFQGRENYYSLKGDMDRYGFDFISGTHLRKDLANNVAEMGGRETISDNPYTQIFADINVALSRMDKKDFLDQLYDWAKEGKLRDKDNKRVIKILDPITVGNRRTYELPDKVTSDQIVLRPNEEGGYDVMQIDKKEWREAIKGVINTQSVPMNLLGKATRFITAGVTRFNPGFAPINAIRHLATNIGNIASEYGMGTAMKVATRFTVQMAKGSPFKAARAAHLIATNNTAELARLAKTDSFYANINDWYTPGGRISWNMAYTNESASKHLVEEIKRTGMIAKSKEAAEYVADVWNNIFEFMNREAAFDTLKKKFAEEGATGVQLNKRAAAVTKNLLNLELAGKYSKDMASWFGLFKAEQTGAVRQIDAIMKPLFTSADKWVEDNYGLTLNPVDKKKALEHWNERRKNAFLMALAALGFGYTSHKMARAVAEVDDDGNNLVGTDDKAQWVRNLRVPTTILGPLKDSLGPNNKFINIPWGFGTGAFASIGAQISMLEDGDVKPKDAAEHMISAAKQSFMPVPLEDWGLFNHNPLGWAIASAAPTPLKPALYFAWNADTFGRQIYNTRTGKYGEAYAGGDYVPEMFKGLAKTLFDATDGAIDWSPHTLQFYANNYLQGVANVTGAVYGGYQDLMGQKDFDIKTDVPMFSSLIGKQTDADAREYADTENEIKKMKARLSALKNTGNDDAYDRYTDKNPNAELLVDRYNKTKAKIDKINKELNKVRASDESPKDTQEERDDLRKIRSSYMKDLNDDFKEYTQD